jgi:hypothetical protein
MLKHNLRNWGKSPPGVSGSPEGAEVHTAQGNALETVNTARQRPAAQQANESPGELLARWAGKRRLILPAPQGLGELPGLLPENLLAARTS